MKVKIIATVEYELNPEHYKGIDDPKDMMEIDVKNVASDPFLFAELAEGLNFNVTGELIES